MGNKQQIDGLIEELGELLDWVPLMEQGVHIPGAALLLPELYEVLIQLSGSQDPRLQIKSEIIPTHYLVGSSGLTDCCKRTLWELPKNHRVTTQEALSNCEGTP